MRLLVWLVWLWNMYQLWRLLWLLRRYEDAPATVTCTRCQWSAQMVGGMAALSAGVRHVEDAHPETIPILTCSRRTP